MTKIERYFLAQDDDGHWYLVKESHRREWNAWAELPEDDPNGWEAPDFAERIDGPSRVTFIDPKVSE